MEPLIITSGSYDMPSDDEIVLTTTSTTGTGSAVWPLWSQQWEIKNGRTNVTTTSWTDNHSGRKTTKAWAAWITQLQMHTASCTSTFDPWPRWNESITSTGGGAVSFVLTGNSAVEAVRPQISDEEYQLRRREQQRRDDEQKQRWATEKRERELARARAQILLRESLTDEQKAELADKRYFSLQVHDSQTGQRRNYRIHQGRARNVEQVDDNGRRLRTLCAHPAIDCPDEDTMLAQKLWLEHREADFLRVANQS